MPQQINLSNTIKDIWKPSKEGESIRGFYLEKTTFPDSQYQKPVYLIGTLDGICIAVNGSDLIVRNMDRLPTDEKVFVYITYLGKKQGKKYEYHDYKFEAWLIGSEEVEYFNGKVDIGVDLSNGSGGESDSDSDNDDDLPF